MNYISFHVLSNIKMRRLGSKLGHAASLPLISGHLFIADEVLNSIVRSATNQTSHCLKFRTKARPLEKLIFLVALHLTLPLKLMLQKLF